MNYPERIFIVGHPGAGKALLAKTLAEKLGWNFIDADIGLEYRIGKPLIEILGKEGAQNFHKCQFNILKSLIKLTHIIVVTDVSIVCDEKNRAILGEEFSVYLKTNTSIQIERATRNPLPLLISNCLAPLFDYLHQDRDDFFEALSDLIIDGNDGNLDKHVADIALNISETSSIAFPKNKIHLDRKDMVLFHKSLGTAIHLPEYQAICLKLLAQGKSSKEIARILDISHRTVEGYIAKLIEKLGCSSSKELIALYHDQP
jgi:shikimate kinase